jgi:two-component system cell cycle sensor histidine kinase/response regulator CckA
VLDLNAVVARMTGILKRTLGEDVYVSLELEPSVRPVKADRGHLEQVVLNLAVNARDAMPDGGRLTIRTLNHRVGRGGTGLPAGDYVRLTVTDTGCGIPDSVQEKVFEPFFTTKGDHGTGLGLATVYGIVAQNGGYIGLTSGVGAGTTFTIDFPVSEEEVPVGETSAPPKFVEGFATVLVVEDDPRVRSIAELVLRRAGHDVVGAAGPYEAIAALKAQPDIDVVLIDLVMPDMNGFDLADEIRRVSPWVRIVFMSGFASDHFNRAVTDPFLAKPFTVESLTNVIERVLEPEHA